MPALANVNGQMQPLSEVRISALDRGFLFGDAVYEVLRVYQGKPWILDEHMKRLADSLAAIRIAGVDLERMKRRMLETIAAGHFQEALVYIQVTRGSAPTRSHAFPENAAPLEFLFVEEFHDRYVELRERGAAAITYADLRWSRCDIKSTILLGNVLAAQAAKEAGVAEAILYLPDGTLVEGSKTSLFAVLDGVLRTAPVSQDILPGITRGFILQLAKEQHVSIEEQAINRSDLPRISELFLTGTTSEVLPLVRVDRQSIGDGKPGPVARQLQDGFQAAVQRWLENPV